MHSRSVPTRGRLAAAALFLIGAAGLVLSFSRSAWVGAAVSLSFAFLVLLFSGGSQVLTTALLGLVVAAVLAPWAIDFLYERFARAPSEIMSVRYEGYEVALEIWKRHPFRGYGLGNFLYGLRQYSVNFATELPVHNVPLWIATETGLFGLVAFYGLVVSTWRRLWRLRHAAGLVGPLAFALSIALIEYCVDGLAEPLYREPVLYLFFWLCVALAEALPRMAEEQRAAPSAA
jgi:O-antigen ligase